MMNPTDGSPRRGEWVLIGLATGLGAALRCWGANRLGLVHFDEGIYAEAATWYASPRGLAALSPSVIPYAPGGYPLLAGVVTLLLGHEDAAALAVSIVAGIATIPLVAGLARGAFGPGAGAGAAFLA